MHRRLNHYGPRTTGASMSAPPPNLPAPIVGPGPNTLIRWTLYLFVLSLPLDAPGVLPLELSTMMGAVFQLATFTQLRLCYAKRPAAFWYFVAYLYVYWLAYIFAPHFQSGQVTAISFVFYIQSILLFWPLFNLMRYEAVMRRVLILLVVAGMMLALMMVLGIGKTATMSQRTVVLGQNPNWASRVLDVGLIVLFALSYGRRSKPWLKILAWPLAGILGLALIMGGSRGGLVALAAGLWGFSFAGKTLGAQIRNTVVVLLLLGLAGWGAYQSPLMQRRIQQAEQGNLAQRQNIFAAAWQMVKDRPLMGWGPSNQTVLAIRLRLPPALHQTRDTHNLYLELLTATGLMGFIPFMTGLWLCLKRAWRARKGPEGMLPLAIVGFLFASNMSDNYIVLKLQWLLLAYVLAAGYFHAPQAVGTPAPRRPVRGPRGSRA